MNAEQMQQSIVHETRLLRVMVLADIASSECSELAEEGYDPQIAKYGEMLQKLSENVAHRVNAVRESRVQKEPGLIVPFRGR